jgi:glycosyltransferase involved in cell wall biosynthesis
MLNVAIVSVSYNTKELTALLLWSLHRVLEAGKVNLLVVDNASADGSLNLLRRARDAGLCDLIENDTNIGHGRALNLAMNTAQVTDADRVWVLDSDCVITHPDALAAPLTAYPDAAVIGEAHWDKWHQQMRFELHSLLLDARAIAAAGTSPFNDDGDPAWGLLQSAEQAGLETASFPFTADGYLIHLGRGSLAAVAAAGKTDNPLYSWAIEHHEPHFGGIEKAQQRHQRVLEQFRAEVGPDLDLAGALLG